MRYQDVEGNIGHRFTHFFHASFHLFPLFLQQLSKYSPIILSNSQEFEVRADR
jgi:hypothetical protein